MTPIRAGQLLRANAAFDLVAGVLLLTGTWDGLWDALDLPQGRPAFFVQMGGASLIGFAYLLWRAAEDTALRSSVAAGASVANALGALVGLVWLVSGELPGNVDALGHALIISLVVVMAAFAVGEAQIGRRPSGIGKREPAS
jgi:hypothetical protein